MPASCLSGPITVASRYPLRILLVLGVLMALHENSPNPKHPPTPLVPLEPTANRRIVPNSTRQAPIPFAVQQPTCVAAPCNHTCPVPSPATTARSHHCHEGVYIAGLGACVATMFMACVWLRWRVCKAAAQHIRHADLLTSLQQANQRLTAESELAASRLIAAERTTGNVIAKAEANNTRLEKAADVAAQRIAYLERSVCEVMTELEEEQNASHALRQRCDALTREVFEKTATLQRKNRQLQKLQNAHEQLNELDKQLDAVSGGAACASTTPKDTPAPHPEAPEPTARPRRRHRHRH